MFDEEPIVLHVPGAPGTFVRKSRQWAASGDAFRAALKELAPQHKDVEIRRRGVVSFSAGWNFIHHLLLSENEQQLLDACILEDGLHSDDLDHWVIFAKRAARGQAWMIMAHSQNKTPHISPKITNEQVFTRAVEESKPKRETLPPYVLDPKLPPEGIRIPVSAVKDATGRVVMPAETKIWDKDCLVKWDNRGDLYLLEYEGDGRPDRVYVMWQVAPRLWRMLGDHWSQRR
jgi:hypothetical protein